MQDMLAMNEAARGDIQKAGDENFSKLQRAAMASAGRMGGGMGGAVLSTQGDMMRQATAGISDALAANSGQRQQIMGNGLSNEWGEEAATTAFNRGNETMDKQRGWQIDDRNADIDADKAAQELSTLIDNTLSEVENKYGDAFGLGDDNPNPEMQKLYNKLKSATDQEEIDQILGKMEATAQAEQGTYDAYVEGQVNEGNKLNKADWKRAKELGLVDDSSYESYRDGWLNV
jgi:hypothetical protein